MKILKKLLMVVLSLALVLSSGVTIVAEGEVELVLPVIDETPSEEPPSEEPAPSLSFTKEVVNDEGFVVENPVFDLFDDVHFKFTVVNDGNTLIKYLRFSDKNISRRFDNVKLSKLQHYGVEVTKTGTPGDFWELKPGESYSFVITDSLNWFDVDRFDDVYQVEKTNTATIKGVSRNEVYGDQQSVPAAVQYAAPMEEPIYTEETDPLYCGGNSIIRLSEQASVTYMINEPGVSIQKEIINLEPAFDDDIYLSDDALYVDNPNYIAEDGRLKVTYRLTVTNIGEMDLDHVVVTDEMDIYFPSWGDNDQGFSEFSLPLDSEPWVVTYDVKIDVGSTGVIENTAKVWAGLAEEEEANQEIRAAAAPSEELEYCYNPNEGLVWDRAEMTAYFIPDPNFGIAVVKEAGRLEQQEEQNSVSPEYVQTMPKYFENLYPGWEWVAADGEPPLYNENEWVFYKFTVTNTGSTGAFAYIEDPMLFGDDPVRLGWLEPEEEMVFYGWPKSFNRFMNPELLSPEEPSEMGLVHNTASVDLIAYRMFLVPRVKTDKDRSFVDSVDTQLCFGIEDGMLVAEDSSTETIKIALPMVSVEKSTEFTDYGIGRPVDYDFVITNTGNVPLETVYFSDYLLSENDYVIDWHDVGPLAVGASKEESLTSTYDEEGRYLNTAFVWGYREPEDLTDFFNRDEVQEDEGGRVAPEAVMECSGFVWPDAQAFDMHEVDVWEVGIDLEKTADKASYRTGETVTYTFTITNVGIRDLYNIQLVDPQLELDEYLGDLVYPELEEGEEIPAELDPIVFTATKIYNSPGTVTNTATATGGFYTYDELDVIIGEGLRGADGLPEVGLPAPPEGSISDTDSVTITITSPPTTNTTPRTTTTTTIVEEEVVPEAVPEPVSLVFVVTGEGNISSSTIDFDDVGDTYTFGPLEGDPGWELTYVGGPDSADLVMIDETTFFIDMDSDKEIHITFEEALTDVLDEDTPEAGEFDIDDEDLPRTGGLPLAVPMALGILMTGLGLGLKKKRH